MKTHLGAGDRLLLVLLLSLSMFKLMSIAMFLASFTAFIIIWIR
jgi:hypothetical protein